MNSTLLVLAAGMGSRYGGLKQLDPVGPSGEVVLDYSVHDALEAGFQRVVFVIRREFEDEFRRTVVARYEKDVDVDLVYQDLNDLPEGYEKPPGREKPWGTGHAIWCARHSVQNPFLAVNADDFYGREAFSLMSSFLDGEAGASHFAMVAYPLSNTLSAHGSVCRGICSLGRNLVAVEECTGIQRAATGKLEGTNTRGMTQEMTGSEWVSMNFWGFQPGVFPLLGKHLSNFLKNGGLSHEKSEFYIPSAVTAMIESDGVEVTVLKSAGQWFGVTYREDRAAVAETISEMVRQGLYETPLRKNSK